MEMTAPRGGAKLDSGPGRRHNSCTGTAALLMALVGLLAGCGGKGDVSTAATTGPSASPTPSSTPKVDPEVQAFRDKQQAERAAIVEAAIKAREDAKAAADKAAADKAAAEAAFVPAASDVKLAIKILEQKCFGSAGCNVSYRVVPSYVGAKPLPSSGSYEVTYSVKGGEDGTQINTLTLLGSVFDTEERESLSTSSSTAKISATVTDVSSR